MMVRASARKVGLHFWLGMGPNLLLLAVFTLFWVAVFGIGSFVLVVLAVWMRMKHPEDSLVPIMRRLGATILGLAVMGSVNLVWLSFYPGTGSNLFLLVLLTSVVWVPLLGIGGIALVVLVVRMRVRDPADSRAPIVCLFLAGVIPFASFVVAATGVPRRAAFVLCRSSFESLVDSASISEYKGEVLDRRLGIFYVDRYAADSRGGVYFRTTTSPDGPDETSYGFAYKPNPEGSPFGNACYRTLRLTGDWFLFRASNDW
jgi:hypothetical protein